MIVRHFIHWVRTAPAGERAEATGELARAYLYSDLSPDDLGAAEGAMLMLLDDPSPLVRRALADALAASPDAPPSIVFALAADQPSIAAPVLALSPLFVDADLVDTVATGGPAVQAAIASRAALPRSVAAAIAEVGTAESCLMLIENSDADVAPFSLDRIVERFGHLAAIREPLLARDDLPAATRQTLVVKLSETLADFVAGRAWLDFDHAHRIAREACEKATVAIAADSESAEVRPLIRHLRASGQLTAGLILRALLSGNVTLFEEALAELADLPIARVCALVHDSGSAGLRALFDKAGLPASTYPAFKLAIDAMREGGFISEPGDAARLKRRVIERVLTGCESAAIGELAPLLTLLRRFATEAARDEARLFCDELAAEPDRIEDDQIEHSEAEQSEVPHSDVEHGEVAHGEIELSEPEHSEPKLGQVEPSQVEPGQVELDQVELIHVELIQVEDDQIDQAEDGLEDGQTVDSEAVDYEAEDGIEDDHALDNEDLDNEVLDNEVLDNEVLDNEVLDNEVLDDEVLGNAAEDLEAEEFEVADYEDYEVAA